MIRGYWNKRYDKLCEEIFLRDQDKNICYTLEIKAHEVTHHEVAPSTEFHHNHDILQGLAEALQMGGYLPQSALDSELKATKYHLEDMRKLVLK